jgi:hypothetical protein
MTLTAKLSTALRNEDAYYWTAFFALLIGSYGS